MYLKTRYFIVISLIFALVACNPPTPVSKAPEQGKEKKEVSVPVFNADSALAFVKMQTDFGPRVPGSDAHEKCASWLTRKLKQYTRNVQVQSFKSRVYDGTVYNGKNIIASFNPEMKSRIMLCAHWDSRPYADHDPDPSKKNQAIDGANDGASGVGVLLEIARLLSLQPPNAGVDIVFFDLEDYGPPEDKQSKESKNEYWGLGSQYWANNPHLPGYRARYAILLDMVGAKDAIFRQEGFSMYYAPDKVKKVWKTAEKLGYGNYFINEAGAYINDDHYYINEIRKVPAIDIIHLDPNSSNKSFYEHWHTSEDTFDKIDPGTLKMVGEVVAATVYWE
jgi:Zn-dependent M28 family amino/carboxypeptidase